MAFLIFFLREPQPFLPQPFFFLMLLTVFFLKRPQPPFTFFASFFPNFFSLPQPLRCAFLNFLMRPQPFLIRPQPEAFFLVFLMAFLIFFLREPQPFLPQPFFFLLLTVFFLKRPQPPFTFFASFFPNFFSRPQPLRRFVVRWRLQARRLGPPRRKSVQVR